MIKKLLILSLVSIIIGILIALDQLINWENWSWEEQFSLHHHEGFALFFISLGVIILIINLVISWINKLLKK